MNNTFLDPKTGRGPYSYDPELSLPNIILITMDMVPPEFYNGQVEINTPYQRSLAGEGISFTKAYATSPLCGPSRASILTGRYTYITGNPERSHDGHMTHLRPEDTIWPEFLKARGYHCRHVGKSHVGTEHFIRAFSENASPWDRWSPPWYSEDAYIRFLKDKGLERFSFKKEIRGMSWRGKRDGNSYGGWLADQNGKPFPEEAIYPSFLVDKAIGSLEARENETQPFYLQLDFFGPHQPFAIPGGWEDREAEIRSKVTLPESWLAWEAAGFPSESDDPRVYDLYRKNWGLRNREDAVNYIIANQLQYEVMDKQLGKLLTYLKSENLYDETMIIFTADHGEMNGRKGCIDKGAYLNPQVLQVPLYLKPAAKQILKDGNGNDLRKGLEILTPVSLLDICPTICESVGMALPNRIDGISLLSQAEGDMRPAEKPLMFDVWNHVMPNPCVGRLFSHQGKNYLYSYNTTTNRDELYDLAESGQINNLINESPELRLTARREMYKALSADLRWDVYNCYFKLEYAEELALNPGDNQKFE